MRRTIPHILFFAALALALLPSAATAQVGICSDDFCAELDPGHPCQCPHCPWVFVECELRYTCAFESPLTSSPDSSATTEPASATAGEALATTARTEVRAAEPTLDRGDRFEVTKALESTRKGDVR